MGKESFARRLARAKLRELREAGLDLLEIRRLFRADPCESAEEASSQADLTRLLPNEVLEERFGLSRKQCRVARLLAAGKSNQEIAQRVGISSHTARHHTQAVLRKLGLSSRAEVPARLYFQASRDRRASALRQAGSGDS